MTRQEFAEHFITTLKTTGYAGARSHIAPFNLPDGWEQFLEAWFNSMQGKDLSCELVKVADVTREELQWPEGDLPEPLNRVEDIILSTYSEESDEGSESATLTLPIMQIDGEWKVIMAN